MTTAAGELPPVLRLLASPMGLLPIDRLLTNGLRDLAARRPELFDRLGEHRACLFVIAPTDLDLTFIVRPDGPRAVVQRCAHHAKGDVRVEGPIMTLLGLLDGTFDGDALFFNRAISVGGRTDALLALRNAIEDAELKPSDLLGLPAALSRVADEGVPRVLAACRGLVARMNREVRK